MRNKYPRKMRMRIYLLICLLCCLFCSESVAETVRNENSDKEQLFFDPNGNLQMTTRDKKASGSVRYRTVGWTIKRMSGTASPSQRIRIRLTQTASRDDPSDPDYVYTYFMCSAQQIFDKIGEASEEWQCAIYQNGGMVYLDAIMTVVEHGQPCGSMDADGTLHGEVYTTAAGIIQARGWAQPESLYTHFNKAVYFSPVPGMIDTLPPTEEKDTFRIRYGWEECADNQVRIQAAPKDEPAYDTTKGIPTGESVLVRGNIQKYCYDAEFVHVYGYASVPVHLAVTYSYRMMTEAGEVSGSYTSDLTLYVSRYYSYYRIRSLKLYGLSVLSTENEALPQLPVELTGLYAPQLTLLRNRGEYVKLPQCHASVYGGDISAGACIRMDELQRIAEQSAGQVWVRNDAFIIDEAVVLDGTYRERQTREPELEAGARCLQVSSGELVIPHTKRNDRYDSYALAIYRGYADAAGAVRTRTVRDVNELVVHTPVVCKGAITDDRAHNQQVTPTPYASLVLGRSFLTELSTYGTHLDLTGYGTRDYGDYTALRQIRFPFPVYEGAEYHRENTWITLQEHGRGSFYLPVGVSEGDYQIRYRTIAKNAAAVAGGAEKNGQLANLDRENYGAYDELTVTVVGRMYDLAITDIVDYPRWRHVFYETDGTKRAFCYRVGRNSLEGTPVAARLSDGIFPVLAGDHPLNPRARAVGLGYTVRLQLLTIGDMRGAQAGICLTPTYYYVSRDGTKRQHVRLYQKQTLTEVVQPLVLTAQNRTYLPVAQRNVEDVTRQAQSVQVWSGTYQLSADLLTVDAAIDLDTYIRSHGGRIRQRDPIFLRDGYLLVRFAISSYRDGVRHLSYRNEKNALHGYCNMWQLQGFVSERTDSSGAHFTFMDGDCLLFDTRYSLHSDYESRGTH